MDVLFQNGLPLLFDPGKDGGQLLAQSLGLALRSVDDVTAPRRHRCAKVGLQGSKWGAVTSEITTVGLDLAKNVFQVHGADGTGRAILRKKLKRAQVLELFGQLAPCVVAMERCGGAHFWSREISRLGHEVRLIPPDYVKPFVKRQKNDSADAEAICEAAVRPTMRFVPVKSEEAPGAAMVFRVGLSLTLTQWCAFDWRSCKVSGRALPKGLKFAMVFVQISEIRI